MVFILNNRNFYPRSPRGERPESNSHIRNTSAFLSTLSSRRATVMIFRFFGITFISIHALLAESDLTLFGIKLTCEKFLSTLSSRRATQNVNYFLPDRHISIHALLAESDPTQNVKPIIRSDFYPRSPRGERQQKATKDRFFCCRTCYITITIRAFSRFVKIFSPL